MESKDDIPERDPIRVLMLCGVGFSATWLSASIMKAAEVAKLDLEIFSDTVDGFAFRDLEKDPFDIILIAPQIRIARRNIVKRADPFGIKVILMDPMAFGMADGEKLFGQLLEVLPEQRLEAARIT